MDLALACCVAGAREFTVWSLCALWMALVVVLILADSRRWWQRDRMSFLEGPSMTISRQFRSALLGGPIKILIKVCFVDVLEKVL